MTAFWEDVRALFQAAAEQPADTRAELLGAADPDVRAEVESLLAAHDEPTPFLDKSALQLLDAADGGARPGSMIGNYRVVGPLGHGGMGTVYLAVRDQSEFAQRVAIKVVRGGESLVQRFRQERQILAALEHPNIARLFDGGTTPDGLPYLVMEYVEGTPIDEYARALPIGEKLRLFLDLCDAVQCAHRSLIIHRDIKPANVLVTPDGVPKLLDFGIAKLVSQTESTSTRVMTPEYASPEQILGNAVTTATDVFSLGVLLFELLAGRNPFAGMTRSPLSEAPRLSEVSDARALRGDLDAIVLTALEVDAGRRYGSVEKLADDVRRHLAGHPIAARNATFAYSAAKFVRRNALAVAAGAAIVVVTAVAFSATLHQKRIAERRFDQVRSLARSVVFELHDAIAPLPGSTSARELLVRRALVYLDNLAAESQANPTLQMELAGAYMKVGDVQGLPYHPNLGDTAGAMVTYRKALGIAREVRDSDPENVAARWLLADVHDRVGFVEQRGLRWPEALQHHEQARAIRQSLPRDDRREVALARTWTAIGDCRYIGGLYANGTPRQAYEAALAVVSRVPATSDALMELGRAHQHLGGYFTGGGRDLPAAIRHHDAALRALGLRTRLNPDDAVARRNLADQYVMKATAQAAAGDGAGALESTTHALEVLTPLATADPKNVEAQHDLAFAYGEQGRALLLLKRFAEAEEVFQRAVTIHQRRLADDPSSAEDRRDLSRMTAFLEDVRARRGPSF